jgi:hypothetical protein
VRPVVGPTGQFVQVEGTRPEWFQSPAPGVPPLIDTGYGGDATYDPRLDEVARGLAPLTRDLASVLAGLPVVPQLATDVAQEQGAPVQQSADININTLNVANADVEWIERVRRAHNRVLGWRSM